jgi:asparagine synthase (glutamine-hydrolysing)
MCGIAGAFAIRPGTHVDPATVERMMDMLAHRGPDGSGIWHDDALRVCLGHRRLSIIDLSLGAQPMGDPESGAVVTFNGEIYNYKELRAGLVAQGASFRTSSDTEVLLRSFARRGLDFVDDLGGMFALGLWDPRVGQLVLARDRVGKKPLYYGVRDDILYFASSFEAVKSALDAPDSADLQEVAGFLSLGYIASPRTIHSSISKLAAGCLAIVDARGVTVRPYWDFARPEEPFTGTWDEAVDHLDELIRAAVSIRLRSDVPLGVFLSGGVDSSLVAAIAAKASEVPVLTFTMGFGEAGFDETSHASAVAQQIGSVHRQFESRFDTLELVPRLVKHFGEPFGDPSAIPTYLLAEQTRKHVTVAVGGDGGDEGFGGYGWYNTAARVQRIRRAVPAGIAKLGAAALGSSGATFGAMGRLARASALLADGEAQRYAALRSLIDPALARQAFAPVLRDAYFSDRQRTRQYAAEVFESAGGTDLRRMRVLDMKTYLADCLMPKVDVATMAHGLEARAPLLDHQVLQFALSLPDEWIREKQSGKRILRAVLHRYLPASLFGRSKQGFDMPLRSWFLRELRPVMDKLPENETLLDTGWFQRRGLEEIVAEHAAGRRDHSLRLYNLLVLESWLRAHG